MNDRVIYESCSMKNDFIELIKMNCGVNQSKLR